MVRKFEEATVTALDRVPDRVRNALDARVLWTGIAFVGLALTFSLSAYAYRAATQETAARLASQNAAAQASYVGCLKSRPLLASVKSQLAGLKLLAGALTANAGTALAGLKPGSVEYAKRAQNLNRLLNAEGKIDQKISLPVPTVAQCQAAREAALSR